MTTPVRIFTPVNRLRQVIAETNGQTSDNLTKASQKRLDKLVPEMKALVAEHVARLTALRADGASKLKNHMEELNDAAVQVSELAGAAEQPRLGDAARGVLAVLPGLEEGGPRFAKALMVHLDSLELLTADPEPSKKDADAILSQLRGMRAALGCTD